MLGEESYGTYSGGDRCAGKVGSKVSPASAVYFIAGLLVDDDDDEPDMERLAVGFRYMRC